MKIKLLIIATFLLLATSVNAQYVKVLGIAEKTGTATVSGIASSNKPSITFPGATITVYSPSGSGTVATIFSDAGGTSRANPNTASLTDASYDFYIQPGVTFDVRVSGSSGGVSISAFTRSGYTAPGGTSGATVMVCGGTNDTTILDAADVIGSTIIIPHGETCASNTQTLSAALQIDSGGLLKPITGQTVTLTGPQIGGSWQRYTNATSGQGTVSFSGNTAVRGVYSAWWGTGGAATTAAQAAIATASTTPTFFANAGDITVNSGLSSTAKTFTLGDSTAIDSSRFIFNTQSSPVDVWANGALTSNFTNGITCGSANYKDHTFNIGYNSAANGTKINSGLVNFGLATESKFCQAPSTSYQTEHYFSWTDPTGVISIRPWGLVVQHNSGDVSVALQGDINFFRHHSNGGGQTALLHENGSFELSFLSTGNIVFMNNQPNTGGIRWRNAAGNNTIAPIYVDNSDDTIIASSTNNIRSGARFFMGGLDTGDVRSFFETDTSITLPGSNLIRFNAGGSEVGYFDPSGLVLRQELTFATDNTEDIGRTSAVNFRPRDVFIGRNLEVGTDINGVVGGVAPKAGTFTNATGNTSVITPLFRSTVAKVLLQGTGTGATQISSTQTTPPTCSSNCGTSPSVVGTDSDMRVTMGGTGTPTSGFVITFNGTWTAAPVCTAAMSTTGMVVGKLPLTVVTTTTTITVVTNGTNPANSDTYSFICRGVQ